MHPHNRPSPSTMASQPMPSSWALEPRYLLLQDRFLLRCLDFLRRKSITLPQRSVSASDTIAIGWAESITHSVRRSPGEMALTLILGPCVVARHFIRWRAAKVSQPGRRLLSRNALPAAFETAYAMLLPWGATPAIEAVRRKTPPSGLPLNIGDAFRSKCIFAFRLTDQHSRRNQHHGPVESLTVVTLSQSSSVNASRFPNSATFVHP